MKQKLILLIAALITLLVYSKEANAQGTWYVYSPEEMQEVVTLSENISISDIEYSSVARVRKPIVWPGKMKAGYMNVEFRGIQPCDTGFAYRMPANQLEADNIYNSQPIRFYKFHFLGMGRGSAVEFGATLKFTMRDGDVKNFNDGIKLWFCLEGLIDNVRFVNNKRSGISINGGGKWVNENGVMGTSNANSNAFEGRAITIIPAPGAYCGLEVINSLTYWNGLTIQLAAKSGKSKYGIVYNYTFGPAATNNKEIVFTNLYFEMDCDSGLIKADTREGDFDIIGCTVVRGNQLFINAKSLGNTRFNFSSFHRGANVKMKGDKNGFWRFGAFPGNQNYLKPEMWDGVKPPNIQAAI